MDDRGGGKFARDGWADRLPAGDDAGTAAHPWWVGVVEARREKYEALW